MEEIKTSHDLSGKRFGHLTAIEPVRAYERSGKKIIRWRCVCDCGNEIFAPPWKLEHGRYKSCGCSKQEYIVKGRIASGRDTGGESNTRLYNVWKGMLTRCYSPKHKGYKDYGGRGITVCQEWKESYETFKWWAILTGYDETAKRGQCTLDRVNNDGNYCPENCRWATMSEQNRNKRKKADIDEQRRVFAERMNAVKLSVIPREI